MLKDCKPDECRLCGLRAACEVVFAKQPNGDVHILPKRCIAKEGKGNCKGKDA